MQHFNELDECDWHNLLQDLLIEYVTLLTNPDSTTLSTPSHKKQERLERDTPREDARTAPARAAPAPAAGEGGGGGAGGGDGGGEGDGDGDGDGDIEEEDRAGDEDAAGAKPAAPKPKDKGLKGKKAKNLARSNTFVVHLFPWHHCQGGACNKTLWNTNKRVRIAWIQQHGPAEKSGFRKLGISKYIQGYTMYIHENIYHGYT